MTPENLSTFTATSIACHRKSTKFTLIVLEFEVLKKGVRMNFISPKNVAFLVAAGLLVSTGTAVAADTTSATKTHTPSPEIVAFKADIKKYRADREAAKNAFKAAIASAKAIKESAMNAATTPEAKAAARTAFQSAVASAKASRDAALVALGTKPVRPIQPAK
jgi:hypothetical protein